MDNNNNNSNKKKIKQNTAKQFLSVKKNEDKS